MMRLLLFLLFFTPGFTIFTQPVESDWILRLTQNGIQVFSRPLPGQMVEEFRARSVLPGNIDSAIEILENFELLIRDDPFWIKNEILQKSDSGGLYVWSEVKMPFFTKNRDIINKIRYSRTSKGFFLFAKSEPDFAPLKPGYVRIGEANIIISLQALNDFSFELSYKSYLDPNDTQSGMYTNVAMVNATYERIATLRKLLIEGGKP